MGLCVVAEGVEDDSTLELLTALGCDRLQGFVISRPLPAHELDRSLQNRSRRAPARL